MTQYEGEDIDIRSFLNKCIEKDIAFYVFARPKSKKLEFGAQLNGNPITYKSLKDCHGVDGFVFAPFHQNSTCCSYFIKKDITKISRRSYDLIKDQPDIKKTKEISVHESSREEYQVQIERMLEDLRKPNLDKVILSRIIVLKSKGRKDAVDSYLKLVEAYPKAFVFMIDIPVAGLWIGATPERLIRKNNSCIETMALAGTQKLHNRKLNEIVWDKKEIEEQAFVAKYIENLFQKFKINDIQKDGPFTALAGNLVHLKTHYTIKSDLDVNKEMSLIEDLHPTPAVCGLPKIKALELIEKVENHQREYYAGYLGPIDANGNLSLFVNLRSMKVLQDAMALYVGGGITADSDPDKEWDETCFKAQTLLNVIK